MPLRLQKPPGLPRAPTNLPRPMRRKTSAWKKCWGRERTRSRWRTKKASCRRWRARRFRNGRSPLVVGLPEEGQTGHFEIRPARVVRRGSKFVGKHLTRWALFKASRRVMSRRSKLRLYRRLRETFRRVSFDYGYYYCEYFC